MPRAAGFLWNRRMMIHVTCRGYAVAQFMQPEPAKYACAPNLEAKTFMQPEQPYYAHHPGRFFYVKDEETGDMFSAPYEPVRTDLDRYKFSLGKSDIRWSIEKDGIALDITLGLPTDDVVELWTLQVRNASDCARNISLYPYFPVGYMSWMNQSGKYHPDLHGIIATCITKRRKTTLRTNISRTRPSSWPINRQQPGKPNRKPLKGKAVCTIQRACNRRSYPKVMPSTKSLQPYCSIAFD